MITKLIDGCALIDKSGNKSAIGVLYCLDGHTYILDAVTDNVGAVDWIYYARSIGGCTIEIDSGGTYFESRGIIVFSDDDATLNLAASKYIAQSLTPANRRVVLGDES